MPRKPNQAEQRASDKRIADAVQMAKHAQGQAREALAANVGLLSENAALRAALVKKGVVTPAEIEAERPKPVVPVRP